MPRSSGRIAWGIDVTHLAPHLTAITLRPEFFDVYLELAVEFALPDPPAVDDLGRAGRLPVPASRRATKASSSPTTSTTTGAPAAPTVCTPPSTTSEPGVTEIHVQPAIDTPEVRALGAYTQGWIDDLDLVTGDDAATIASRRAAPR